MRTPRFVRREIESFRVSRQYGIPYREARGDMWRFRERLMAIRPQYRPLPSR